MIGGSGNIVKTFDKIAKSFVVLLMEKDTRIRFPRTDGSFSFPKNPAVLSAEFEGGDSPSPNQAFLSS